MGVVRVHKECRFFSGTLSKPKILEIRSAFFECTPTAPKSVLSVRSFQCFRRVRKSQFSQLKKRSIKIFNFFLKIPLVKIVDPLLVFLLETHDLCGHNYRIAFVIELLKLSHMISSSNQYQVVR